MVENKKPTSQEKFLEISKGNIHNINQNTNNSKIKKKNRDSKTFFKSSMNSADRDDGKDGLIAGIKKLEIYKNKEL